MTPDEQRQAECARHDPELWFSTVPSHEVEAIRICRGCPVRAACLSDALHAEGGASGWGIFGGLDPSQRRALAARGSAGRPQHARRTRDASDDYVAAGPTMTAIREARQAGWTYAHMARAIRDVGGSVHPDTLVVIAQGRRKSVTRRTAQAVTAARFTQSEAVSA